MLLKRVAVVYTFVLHPVFTFVFLFRSVPFCTEQISTQHPLHMDICCKVLKYCCDKKNNYYLS